MTRLAFWLLAALMAPALVSAQPPGTLSIEALQRGGHVLIMRHGTSERVQEPSPLDLADCAVQHRLTDRGWEESRAIAERVRALGIPIGRVLVSPCCRTTETGRLAFGRTERFDTLLHPSYVPLPGVTAPPDFPKRIEMVKQVLATAPPAGTNTVLVTHGEVIKAATGLEAAMGDALIYRPEGSGSTLVARVLPGQWRAAGR